MNTETLGKKSSIGGMVAVGGKTRGVQMQQMIRKNRQEIATHPSRVQMAYFSFLALVFARAAIGRLIPHSDSRTRQEPGAWPVGAWLRLSSPTAGQALALPPHPQPIFREKTCVKHSTWPACLQLTFATASNAQTLKASFYLIDFLADVFCGFILILMYTPSPGCSLQIFRSVRKF